MTEEDAERLRLKSEKLGGDLWYTLKDIDGDIRLMAGIWASDGYGREAAESAAKRLECMVTLVKMVEVDI